MAKAKTASEKISGAAQTYETAFKTGTEALKSGFEKASAGYDQLVGHTKDTVEAYVEAATLAGKGAETLNNEIYAFSRQTVEDSIGAAKALFATKSLYEAFEIQSSFARAAFEAYVGEVSKISEIAVASAKESFEPIQNRFQTWVDTVQTLRAA